LNTAGPTRDRYLSGAPSLQGRAMFVPARPDMRAAAVIRRDARYPQKIQELVHRHFLVRTRADAYTVEARADDHRLARQAIRSGAQVVSTDFPSADPEISGYFVQLPGEAIARCNPISAPQRCRDRDVEGSDPAQ
jgi:hypothetical protein